MNIKIPGDAGDKSEFWFLIVGSRFDLPFVSQLEKISDPRYSKPQIVLRIWNPIHAQACRRRPTPHQLRRQK